MQYLGAVLLLLVGTVHSYNIVAIIPVSSYSHQIPVLALCKELARRGHNLSVISTNPPKERIENFTVIDISSMYEELKSYDKRFGFSFEKHHTPFQYASFLTFLAPQFCEYQLSLPQVKEFMRNAENMKIDLVIIENLIFSSYFGFIHKIGFPPVVGVSTFTRWSSSDWVMGVPVNPSYIPNLLVSYTDEMSFHERVYNTLLHWWIVYQTEIWVFPEHDRVLRENFGNDLPSAREMEYNKSLSILFSDETMDYPVPHPPNVISVGALHVEPPKALPKDLHDWMNGAENGVVYISFGSNKKSSMFSKTTREAFVNAFAKFPKIRFLWKWESVEKIPGLTENVLTQEWFPQQDLFANPKLRAVVYQGGLQSSQEVLHYGIPVIGIPFFGDQVRNIRKLENEGAAVFIPANDITFDRVYDALDKVLHNSSYKTNAKRLSRITHDRIVSGMDTAIWWIEYVIRHDGAKHLRVGSLKQYWFQTCLLDVYLFLLVALLTPVFVLYKTAKCVICNEKNNKYNKKKTN